MADGVDPAVAAAIRATVGLVGLLFLSQLPGFKAPDRINAAIALRSAASGLLGMGAGMTLVLFALSRRPIGVVSTLSGRSPLHGTRWTRAFRPQRIQGWLALAFA